MSNVFPILGAFRARANGGGAARFVAPRRLSPAALKSALLCLTVVVACLSGCSRAEPSRWDAAQQATTGQPAVSEKSVEGSAFNRFFPQVESPWDIVFKQEKTGFAQASLQKDGREMAVLSVSDTVNNPEAAEKYAGSETTLADYPRAEIGEMATGILVGDRYQVQIRSMDPEFGPAEREAWLTKFNLEAIGRIR